MPDSSPSTTDDRAAIAWTKIAEDGPFFGYDSAKVQCNYCDGWTGTECPEAGCGVRLVSIQAEEDVKFMARMREEAAERKAYREQRRAERNR